MDNSQKPNKPERNSLPSPRGLQKARAGMAARASALPADGASPIKSPPNPPSDLTIATAASNIAKEDNRRASAPVHRSPLPSAAAKPSSMPVEDVFEMASDGRDSAGTSTVFAKEEEIRRASVNCAKSSTVADDDDAKNEVLSPSKYSSQTSYRTGDGSGDMPRHRANSSASPPMKGSTISPRASLADNNGSPTLFTSGATISPRAASTTEDGARNLSHDSAMSSTRRSPSGIIERATLPPWERTEAESPQATESMAIDTAQDYPLPPSTGSSSSAGSSNFIDELPEASRLDSMLEYSDELHRQFFALLDQFSFWHAVNVLWAYIKAFVTSTILEIRTIPLWFLLVLLVYIGNEAASQLPTEFQHNVSRFPGQIINPIIGLPNMLLNGISKVKLNHRNTQEFDCCRLSSPSPNCHCPITEEESYAKAADYIFRIAEESNYAKANGDTTTEDAENDSYTKATDDAYTTSKVAINYSKAIEDTFTMVTDAEKDLIRELRRLAYHTIPHEGHIADLLRKYRILIEPTGLQKFISRLYSVREQIQQELYREAQYLADIFPAEGRIAAVLREFGMLEKSPSEKGRAAFQALVDKLKSYIIIEEEISSTRKGAPWKKALKDKLTRKGSAFPNKCDAEHATAKALWDVLKIAEIPVTLEGSNIYLNGHLVTTFTTWDEIFEIMRKGSPVMPEFDQYGNSNSYAHVKNPKSQRKAGKAYPEGKPFVASKTKRTGMY